MDIFNFNELELITFFGVLVRFSVLFSILPFLGDRMIPSPVKILLALGTTVALFPTLLSTGVVKTSDTLVWAKTGGGIAVTIILEVVYALVLGYTAKLVFDAVSFGANLAGNFMGLASASVYDPHQESQSQVLAEIQLAIAMLLFLAINGHYFMLKAVLQSYEIVGMGKAGFSAGFASHLAKISGQVMLFGLQIAGPVAIALFSVSVAFGVLAKAMPQLNILVLSMSVSVLVGLGAIFISLPEFGTTTIELLGKMIEWMNGMSRLMVA